MCVRGLLKACIKSSPNQASKQDSKYMWCAPPMGGHSKGGGAMTKKSQPFVTLKHASDNGGTRRHSPDDHRGLAEL